MDSFRGINGGWAPNQQSWKRLILDLDIATDPGDAGALVMANILEKRGLAVLLGTMCCATYLYSPGCASAFNTYHGRSNRIVSVNKGPELEPGPDPTVYNQFITENFPNSYPIADDAPDAIIAYREMLAGATDNSLTICAIGQLANLAHVMASSGDSISPLTGLDLMLQKVAQPLVIAAGDYPTGFEYNIYTDWTSAKYVCDNWTGEIHWLGFTPPLPVETGQAIIDAGDQSNPLYWAFKLFKDINPTLVPRSSWDQLALLLAVYGPTFQGTTYFNVGGTGHNTVASDGTNTWVNDPSGKQKYFTLAQSPAFYEALIDQMQGEQG